MFVRAFAGLCGALSIFEAPGKGPDGKPKTLRLHFVGTAPSRAAADAAGLDECKKFMSKAKLQHFCKVIKVVCSDDRR